MAYQPGHKSAASVSSTNLVPPSSTDVRQRRMTSPSLPPPSPLNLPEPVYGYRRPPSPLRHASTIDPTTGEVSDDGSILQSEESREGRQWGQRHHSPSPSPSVAHYAANFAQKVGSLMSSSMSPRSNTLPTDDELEAEAEKERDRTRKEAEQILMQEAENRRSVEDRVMAMLNSSSSSLPPPPRSQTMPVTPPSPHFSQKESPQKEGGWWSMAKSRLTPTKEPKEPLTPAQQIIQETKTREKEQEKEKKKSSKMKQKSKEWSPAPETQFEEPSFIKSSLAAPTTPSRPVSSALSSPTPHPGVLATPPSLAASPLRSMEGGSSPSSRGGHPIYAQFNAQGTLDVPGTLLTIAKRFEKLEKWTVGHVRALEERMDDVERWLVEKEREKTQSSVNSTKDEDDDNIEGAMSEVREELAELQGRVGELGREMAKLITAPGNLSSGPSRNSASIARAPSTTSIAVRSISQSIAKSPTSTPPKVSGSTSPPFTTPTAPRGSRTRLPYPTGDYATPPDSTVIGQGMFSPANSPPSSITSATRSRHMSISGLPNPATSPNGQSLPGLPRAESPVAMAASSPTLPPPSAPASARPSSVSPTPRKRYTVALGGPIMAADRAERVERERPVQSRTQPRELSTAFFSTSPISMTPSNDESTDDSDSGVNEETIGKAAARQAGLAVPTEASGAQQSRSPSASPTNTPTPARRSRPQTMYASQFSGIAAPSPVTPLNIRLRSRSTDRFGLGLGDGSIGSVGSSSSSSVKFVDPLLVRRQTKEALASAAPNAPKVMPGKPKVPVGELVAFFDQDKA
ncbi:uncharacterized protein FIBRA_07704 [Fibroporia radiculosa]|uniref:Uncharacterized protein n=1 Tax=Fibroporia radiculosa TaxID=599839 RepID=J4GFC3_9APHY|nr:uncharacterized protein FIBRA_07704 [Fibroporia radiculosa]CCM05483.1 predicted protein [Fibroporia radiculosa]